MNLQSWVIDAGIKLNKHKYGAIVFMVDAIYIHIIIFLLFSILLTSKRRIKTISEYFHWYILLASLIFCLLSFAHSHLAQCTISILLKTSENQKYSYV